MRIYFKFVGKQDDFSKGRINRRGKKYTVDFHSHFEEIENVPSLSYSESFFNIIPSLVNNLRRPWIQILNNVELFLDIEGFQGTSSFLRI